LQNAIHQTIRSSDSLVVYENFHKSTCCRAQHEAYDVAVKVKEEKKWVIIKHFSSFFALFFDAMLA
jgi:hypothetical protein